MLAATLGLLLSSAPSQASEHCPRTYRVGVSQIGYSYYLLDDGTPAGSSFDFYAELARRSGCTFEIDPLPRMRAWHEAKLQHLDIISPTIRTAERDQMGVFIEYFKARNDILVDRRAGEHIQSLEQVLADPKVKIGLVRGHSSGPYFDKRLQALEKLQRIEFSSYPSNIFIKLQAGRIQATLMTAGIYQKELDQLGLQDQVGDIGDVVAEEQPALPARDDDRRHRIADEIGDRPAFAHEPVDAQDQRHARHRHAGNDRQRRGQGDEARAGHARRALGRQHRHAGLDAQAEQDLPLLHQHRLDQDRQGKLRHLPHPRR